MNDFFNSTGKFLIITGLIIVVVGLVFYFFPKIPFIGRLPGDIYVKKENFIFYMPLTTSLLISIILTIIVAILKK